jgi:phage baseplate assembly protein W
LRPDRRALGRYVGPTPSHWNVINEHRLYPYIVGATGLTAVETDADHVRGMIEQLLLTNPGERVNQPGLGAGLYQLLFEPNSPELAATLQLSLQAAIQRYLADVVAVQSLNVTADNELLQVQVNYILRQTGEVSTAQVELSPGGP